MSRCLVPNNFKFNKTVLLLFLIYVALFASGCKNKNPTDPGVEFVDVGPSGQPNEKFWIEQITPYYAHHNGRGREWATYIKLNTKINLDSIQCINWEIKTPKHNWQDKITGWQITYIDNDCDEPLLIRAKIKYYNGHFSEIVTTSSLTLNSQCSNLDPDPQYSSFGEKLGYCNL
ncbi:MAG: hypothetical protein ACE5NG_07220 [bacterium]